MKQMNELELIARIKKMFAGDNAPHGGLILGIGDDCAAFRPSRGKTAIVTTDTLCEGVHFVKKLSTPESVGVKAAAVNLSDIASMGGAPRYVFLSMNITKNTGWKWLARFLEGFKSVIERHGCQLAGGNVSSAKNDLSFTVAVYGEVDEKRMLTRRGAKPGDLIYVTGTPGDSALGLSILMKKRGGLTSGERRLISRHLAPTPRVEWGKVIAEQGVASAMIDISDGTLLDLHRVMEASGTAAVIELGRFPLSAEARKIVDAQGRAAWERVLTGGEDYELLFTAPKGKVNEVERLVKNGELCAVVIGQIVKGKPKVKVMDSDGREMKIKHKGWIHGE